MRGRRKTSAEFDESMVFEAVVQQADLPVRLLDPVQQNPSGVPSFIARFLKRDVVKGITVAIGELEPGPFSG